MEDKVEDSSEKVEQKDKEKGNRRKDIGKIKEADLKVQHLSIRCFLQGNQREQSRKIINKISQQKFLTTEDVNCQVEKKRLTKCPAVLHLPPMHNRFE